MTCRWRDALSKHAGGMFVAKRGAIYDRDLEPSEPRPGPPALKDYLRVAGGESRTGHQKTSSTSVELVYCMTKTPR